MPLAPNEPFGAFVIVDRLGAGGMGEVYRARDTRLEREVALKVLPAATREDATARARLLREARLASRLNHPNVCTIHEVGEVAGQAFIAMELIEGPTLATRIATGALPAGEVLRIGAQVAAALAHAHAQGVLHRDLKSANIAITAAGDAKVLDFGLAKRLADGDLAAGTTIAQNSLTEPGVVAGTLAYMAPEQLRGEPADARSDVWALGVVLFEMTAGQRPFAGRTAFELTSAILERPSAPLPASPTTPMGAVIERCLAKDPGCRYQDAAEVRDALTALQSGTTVLLPRPPRALARRRSLLAAGVVAVLVAALALVSAGGWRSRRAGGGGRAFDSLAVLPFENLSGDPEQAYLAAGIHEALITSLAKLGALDRVIARASTVRYEKTDKPLAQVARELAVTTLMTGTVVRSGSRVMVTAHLIDAASDAQLWSDSFERELSDVLVLQNEIVAAILRASGIELTAQGAAQLASARPVEPASYEAYLKGMFWLHKLNAEGFDRGLAYLQQAIDADPTSPLPYAGLALGYCLIGHERLPDAFVRARQAAQKARQLGGALAETELAFAEIAFYSDWDLPAAVRDLREALRLDPSLAEAHRHYSWYLNWEGRAEEALAEMKRAEELDPLTPTYAADLGWQSWMLNRHEEAVRLAHKALELNPELPVAWTVIGNARAAQGRFEEAVAAHERAAAAPAWRWALGRTYALAGRGAEARKVAATLAEQPTPIDAWGLAAIYAALGANDEALTWLEKARELRFSWLPWVDRDPFFVPLYQDPRFADLVRRIRPAAE